MLDLDELVVLKISHITERSLSAKNATLAQIFLFGFERLLPVLISTSVSTICPEVQPFVATCRGLFSLEVKTCPRVGVHRVAPVDSQRPVLRLAAEPSKGGSLEVGSSSGSV